MILIIDGYNVLKQVLHNVLVSCAAKDSFVMQLNKYGKIKGHAIILVFDGGPTERSDRDRVGCVTVIHSGIHESADDWIKRYVFEHKELDVLLASTDRELGRFASRHGAICIDALDFYHLLQQSSQKQQAIPHGHGKLIKTAEHEIPELDDLMKDSSGTMQSKSEDIIDIKKTRTAAAHTVSKKERAMAQKLKKL